MKFVGYGPWLEKCCQNSLFISSPFNKVIAKAAFNKKQLLFSNTLDLNLRKKPVKCYIWSTPFYGAEIWTLRNGSEISGNFRNVLGKGERCSVGPIV
jgi:hypothetical protein